MLMRKTGVCWANILVSVGPLIWHSEEIEKLQLEMFYFGHGTSPVVLAIAVSRSK